MPWANTVWRRSLKPIEEQGFVIVALGDTYVECARRLAASVRRWHPGAKICLITDQQPQDHSDFDHVRVLRDPCKDNAWANDWQVFGLTPFRETIKLEADMLIVSDISHWWTQLRHRDVVISTGCRDWQDRVSTRRSYRRVFDENHLPDVYNAVTYWRLSRTAQEFFDWVRVIFQNWAQFRRLLRFSDDLPSTDLVYAMAAEIIGPELVTLPWATYPRIVHMKQHIAGTRGSDWTQEFLWEYHDGHLRVNTIPQWGAFHYYQKAWRP